MSQTQIPHRNMLLSTTWRFSQKS